MYYTSEYVPPGVLADGLWFDISSITGRENVDLANPTLSDNYRYFAVSVRDECNLFSVKTNVLVREHS